MALIALLSHIAWHKANVLRQSGHSAASVSYILKAWRS